MNAICPLHLGTFNLSVSFKPSPLCHLGCTSRCASLSLIHFPCKRPMEVINCLFAIPPTCLQYFFFAFLFSGPLPCWFFTSEKDSFVYVLALCFSICLLGLPYYKCAFTFICLTIILVLVLLPFLPIYTRKFSLLLKGRHSLFLLDLFLHPFCFSLF